jgi:hypothetical protein
MGALHGSEPVIYHLLPNEHDGIFLVPRRGGEAMARATTTTSSAATISISRRRAAQGRGGESDWIHAARLRGRAVTVWWMFFLSSRSIALSFKKKKQIYITSRS